jgi:hypothetical protein
MQGTMSTRRFVARGAPPLLAAGAVELTTSAGPASARALGQYPVVRPALNAGDVAVMSTTSGAMERGSDATLQARRAIVGVAVTDTSNGSVSVAETGIVETSITGLGKGASAVTCYSSTQMAASCGSWSPTARSRALACATPKAT